MKVSWACVNHINTLFKGFKQNPIKKKNIDYGTMEPEVLKC